jgi:predicted short-subunit dehydrogenase-like oxidoreductase (DUF2520 family)
MELDALRIVVVGAGRMGTALSAALRAAGLHVSGPLGKGADGSGADLVILCVPDRAIADAARVISLGPLVAHCSGATSLEPLRPHEALSLHPLTTIAPAAGPEAFFGVGCAISGSSERALAVASALTTRLGMHPVEVADANRDLYHAAASLASNYLVTLEAAAESLFARAGVERTLVAPLVRAAVENWAVLGAERALTGPIARGDVATVARQRAAVAQHAPDLVPLWDALAAATKALAGRRRTTPVNT